MYQFPVFRVPGFLFHPHITLTAFFVTLGSFAAIVAGLNGPLTHFFGPTFSGNVVNAALIVAPISAFIATVGRSPIKAVDNNER